MQAKREYLCPITEPKPDETPIYRHPMAKDGFLPPLDNRKVNMQQQLLIQFEKFSDKKTLGTFNEETQQYDHITYKEIQEIATSLGSSLCQQDSIKEVKDQQNNVIKPVGIYLSNRREWTLIDVACILYGFTSCPFYDTLGVDSITYSMNITQVSVCFVQPSTIGFLAKSNLPYLKTIVTIGAQDPNILNTLAEQKKEVITWDDYIKRSNGKIQPYPNLQPQHPLTLVFTSGTTGEPKAAIQSHLNFTSMIALFEHQDKFALTQDDVYLSYLPLPHTFERVVHLAALSGGAELNYYSGNIQNIAKDIQRCKPTYFCGVPRIFNRFYEGIQAQLNSFPPEIQQKFELALAAKIKYFRATGKTTHDQLDEAFVKTRAILGGRQRIMITGAAPISPKILEYLKMTFCCQIIEGYGQTETTAASFLTDFNDPVCGHIGGPTISQEFKLVSVPEMDYLTDQVVDGQKKIRGEVCLRGPSVIKSYFNNVQSTKETIDEEGWVHTGDIGEIVDGALKLIDRKKNLFKLSQGEYVSPEKIENCYLRVKGISEIVVFGDSLSNYCVGVIVPEQTFLKQWATELNIQGDHQQLCQDKTMRAHVLKLVNEQGKQDNLNGFEQIKNVYLEPRPFIQVGILTETMKMQRHKARQNYQDIIKFLYQEI
ncbi:unnamed protein product [Paramecium primaurelia]|uniref:AMP-dependent synthetase/ligase domain-containing protein n=1 Tax=Paramecium primaurelia TaxID=5886 RepID=A0A8S1LSF7_PARPR|nr:unnamed protein product [Paramecium primaurelia]